MLNKVLIRDFCEEVIFEIQRTGRSHLKSRGKSLSSNVVACANDLWQEFDMFKKRVSVVWGMLREAECYK